MCLFVGRVCSRTGEHHWTPCPLGGGWKGTAGTRCSTGATQFGVCKPMLVAQIISILLPSNAQEMWFVVVFFSVLVLLFLLKDACTAYPF